METESYEKLIIIYSHKLTLGRAKECQMILRFVTNSRPVKASDMITYQVSSTRQVAQFLNYN